MRSSHTVALRLPSLLGLCSLTKLDISDCNLGEGAIPSDIGNICSLKELYLSKNRFFSLPASINLLSKLWIIELEECQRLQSLPQLPSNIEQVQEVSKPIPHLSIVVPGSEISKCFRYQKEDSAMAVTMPLFLRENEVVGYAMCCVFNVRKGSCGIKRLRSFPTHQLSCHKNASYMSSFIHFKEKFGQAGSDHLWLFYLSPKEGYSRKWNFKSPDFVLSFQSDSGPGLEVKCCGFHPVYRHEVVKCDHATNRWTRSIIDYNLNGNLCTRFIDHLCELCQNQVKLNNVWIGNGNGDVKGLRLPLLSNKSWQFQLQFQQRNKEKKKRQNVTISYTNSSSGGDSASAALELEVNEIRESCKMWKWKGQYSINYLVSSTPNSHPNSTPLLLVHGFGASIPHWRRNIGTLAKSYTVYAIDLLGFGASDKPAGYSYTMEGWAQLILDFLDEVVKKPTVLIGNSVGSLACVIAASESSQTLVQGLVLLNCAGGMNNKAIVDDWRIKLLLPLLWFIDFLLKQRPIASAIFERVKQRETLRNILLSIYANKESVDETLVEIIREPANEEGALDAFVSIVTGPPGPNPVQLMPSISIPVLVLWGDKDPFTPLDGPVGKYFSSLPSKLSNVKLIVLDGVGHCPHDDRPELVHEKLLPWLAETFNF
ncbi:AB hydrolase-1 domain-containing protein [Citrus sinensis]|nr:AB hydrolase-1 domain-containing protein [Citrus sinensis]